MQTKTCTKCKKTKDIDSFGKSKASADGLQYYCKRCKALYQSDSEERKIYQREYQRRVKIVISAERK